jgi:hypothetical protein
MQPVRAIIAQLGGVDAVVEAYPTAITHGSVQRWVDHNYVPEHRHQGLIAAAKKLGKSLKEEDFPPEDQSLRIVG